MKRIKGLDYRSIGLFRIALGLFVIFNIITLKLGSFDVFFSITKGFIPAPIKATSVFQSYLTSDFSILVIFLLAIIFAFFMLIGYRSRICALFLFFFYAFYNVTFWHLSFGFDRYIEVLLFAAILLPLDSRFSIFKPSNCLEKNDTNYYSKWPAYFIILQIGLIYTISGIAKNGILWQNGTAVGVLLLDDLMTLPLATKLFANLALTKSLTYLTIIFESVALLLLFFPWKNQITRILFCLSILSFHWGLSFFVNVGHFKLVGTLAVILLLPQTFWKFANPLERILNNIEGLKSLRFSFKFPDYKPLTIVWRGIGIIVIYGVIASNVYMISKQGDAMGKFMRKYNLDGIAKTMHINSLEDKGTVFNQNWYLYAPNPNIFLGKICFVGTTYQEEQIDLETNTRYISGNHEESNELQDLRKYFNTKLRNQINKQKNPDMSNDYAQYLVMKWEEENQMPLKAVNVYNHFFNAKKVVEGEPKKVEIYNFITVDLDKVRRSRGN